MIVVQFQISRSFAEAISLETIEARARAAGIHDVRFARHDVMRGDGAPGEQLGITCSREMAVFLCGRIVERADRTCNQDLLDCVTAVRNILDGLAASAA